LTVLGLAPRLITGGNAATVTVTDCDAEPPVPVQFNPNSVVLESAPDDQIPCVATPPLQPPVPAQVMALVVLQFRVALPPLATVDGEAVKVMVGTGTNTATTADPLADPPGPVQVSV
jgi:hypothetical protein